MDAPSPALQAARRLARRASCPILPIDGTLPAAPDGAVLLVDAEPSEALLSALAAALPRAEALVLWVPGWDVQTAADALGRHGFEHGSVDGVALPEPGVLAVLCADEARADRQAAALAAREKPFRALAIMPAYNEADVIGPAIGALIAEGVDVYLLDHRSTDATVAAAQPWLGRGLVRIERFPDESGPGFDERNKDEMVWKDILRRVEQVAHEHPADWCLFVNADEFRESPWPGVTLAEGLREADDLGFSAVNFELINFAPTPDDASSTARTSASTCASTRSRGCSTWCRSRRGSARSCRSTSPGWAATTSGSRAAASSRCRSSCATTRSAAPPTAAAR